MGSITRFPFKSYLSLPQQGFLERRLHGLLPQPDAQQRLCEAAAFHRAQLAAIKTECHMPGAEVQGYGITRQTFVYCADQACELLRSEEHTSELQSLMRSSYAVFCLKKKNKYKKDSEDERITQH